MFLVFAGCAEDEEPALQSPATTGANGEAADRPSVTVASPKNGETLDAGDVEVEVDVENFDVVNKLGRRAVVGEGHLHYYFDVDRVPMDPGKPAVTKDKKTYHAAAETSHTWQDVDEGVHSFAVQLVNNDHTPLTPPVTARATVTIE